MVATPTNYDSETNRFDTSSVDAVVSDALELNADALVVIKSTIPVGHTKSLKKRFRQTALFSHLSSYERVRHLRITSIHRELLWVASLEREAFADL